MPRDGDKCINCKQPVRNGVIKHQRTCPDFVKEKIK